MKTKLFFLVLIFNLQFSIFNCFSQAGEWVWLKGDSTYSVGYYGNQGVPAQFNNPPSIYEPCEWTDLNGDFWMFGGLTGTTYVGDLWRYHPLTNEWTWMKGTSLPDDTGNYGVQGIASLLNNPPSRSHGIASWRDNQNNLWMFGGQRDPILFLNYSDLWKYDVSTNEWTWMKGPAIPNQPGVYGIQGIPNPANNPPALAECAAAWVDNAGDLWMFGGNSGYDDLWRYNISSNQWTWMRGLQSSISYGVKNIESPSNTPGSRWSYTNWKNDTSGFWLFGGADFQQDLHNDLWRFNTLTNNWTWINGDSTTGSSGYYNVKCLASSNNLPLARFENRACWTDTDGNFWFFGGTSSYDHSLTHNDLWMYCIATNQWILQSGDSISNPSGHWGTIEVSSPLNVPNGRSGSIGWSDGNGHLYLFAGSKSPFPYPYNDIWKFTIDTTCGVCPTATSIEEENSNNASSIEIFPNPSSDNFTIRSSDNVIDKIEIFNLLGEEVYEKQLSAAECQLSTRRFGNGIYIVKIYTHEKIFQKKLMVNH